MALKEIKKSLIDSLLNNGDLISAFKELLELYDIFDTEYTNEVFSKYYEKYTENAYLSIEENILKLNEVYKNLYELIKNKLDKKDIIENENFKKEKEIVNNLMNNLKNILTAYIFKIFQKFYNAENETAEYILYDCRDQMNNIKNKVTTFVDLIEGLNLKLSFDIKNIFLYEEYYLGIISCLLFQRLGDGENILIEFIKIKKLIDKIENPIEKKNYLGKAFLYKGVGESITGNFNEAVKSYNSALDYFSKIKNDFGKSLVLNSLSRLYTEYFSYNKEYRKNAVELLKESINIKNKLGDMFGLSLVFLNLARLYKKSGKYDDMEKSLLKCLEISEKEGYKGILPSIHLEFLDLYNLSNKLDNMKETLNKIYPILSTDVSFGLYNYYFSLYHYNCILLTKQGDFLAAVNYLKNSKEYFKENNYESGISRVSLLEAKLYSLDMLNKNYNILDKENDFITIKNNLRKALRIFIKQQSVDDILESQFMLGYLYFLNNNKKESLIVWQMLIYFCRKLESENSQYINKYLKMVKDIDSTYTEDKSISTSQISNIFSHSTEIPSIILIIRCENMKDVYNRNSDNIKNFLSMFDLSIKEIVKSMDGMNYYNDEFIDYFIILPINGKRDFELMIGLTIILYKIFSKIFEIKLSLTIGNNSYYAKELEDLIYIKYNILCDDIDRIKESFNKIKEGRLIIEKSIITDLFPVSSYKNETLNVGDKDFISEIDRFQEELERLKKEKATLEKTIFRMFTNLEKSESIKIENYLNRLDKLIKESINIEKNESDLKNKLNEKNLNDNERRLINEKVIYISNRKKSVYNDYNSLLKYKKNISDKIEKEKIDFDIEKVINYKKQIFAIDEKIKYYESKLSKADEINIDETIKQLATFGTISKSSVIKNEKNRNSNDLKKELSYIMINDLCPNCFSEYKQNTIKIGENCIYCNKKIDNVIDGLVNMKGEAGDFENHFRSQFNYILNTYKNIKDLLFRNSN